MLLPGLSSLLAAAVVGSVLLALIYVALRHNVAMIVLLLAVWIASAALRDTVDLAVTVESLRITVLDILSLILAFVGIGRVLLHGIRGLGEGLALALLLLVAVHAARGAVEFGAQTAISSARPWMYFTAPLVYAATVPGGWDRRVWKIVVAAGVVLVAIAASYFLVGGVGSASTWIYRDGRLFQTRPIIADGALVILQAAILASALRWPSRHAAAYVALGAGAAVLLLQHRTTWVAGIIVAVVGFVSWIARQGRNAEPKVLVTSGAVLLLLPVAIWGFTQSDSLVESASEATSSDSTLTWRTEGWAGLIASNDSASQLAVGDPSGADQSRRVRRRIVDVTAHNAFIDAYVRFGLLGVTVFVWLGLLLWLRRRTVAAGTGLSATAVGLLLVTQLVFSMTYSLGAIQGLILGALIAGLTATSPAPTPAVSRSRLPEIEYAVR